MPSICAYHPFVARRASRLANHQLQYDRRPVTSAGQDTPMPSDDELKENNQRVIAAFRANGGQVPGSEANPVLLLTTTGARSGRPHTAPLAFMTDGDCLVIF